MKYITHNVCVCVKIKKKTAQVESAQVVNSDPELLRAGVRVPDRAQLLVQRRLFAELAHFLLHVLQTAHLQHQQAGAL